MVLKVSKKIFIFLFCITSQFCFSQENYWSELFKTAFSNSSKVNEYKAEYLSTVINKKQYDYLWFPSLQTSLQNSLNASRGDYLRVLNQNTDPEITWVTSPSASISINQKLPGSGNFSLGTGYGFNYSLDHKAFIQWPQIQLGLNQKLSRGAFGITKNPEYLLMKEQMSYSTELYRRNLYSELQNILELIQKTDILNAQEAYYRALVIEYESELNTSREKQLSGMQSNLLTHYADHQYSESLNNLNNILHEKENVLNELKILIPDFSKEDLTNERSVFCEIIQNIYDRMCKTSSDVENNFEAKLFSSIQKQYLYQFQNNEINYAPELILSSSLNPDSNFTSYYSDWYKSFRVLKETPYPINFTFTIGIKKQFELPQAKKLRKEILLLNQSSIEKDFYIRQENQKKEIGILTAQIQIDSEYLEKLNDEIKTEQSFREKRKELLDSNFITQDDFYQSETLYFKIYTDYIQTFWKNINNEIKVINACSEEIILLNQLLGENYDF